MAKVRAYELARELNIDTTALLTLLRDTGEFVRSASSTIEAPAVRRVREKVAGMADEERARLARKPEAPRTEWPRRGTPADLELVEPRGSDPARLTWPAGTRTPGRSRPGRNPFLKRKRPPAPAPDLDALMAELWRAEWAADRQTPSEWSWKTSKTETRRPDPWAMELFEPSEKQAWQSAGVYDVKMAAACRAKGLSPDDLSERVAGRRFGERLMGGESLGWVFALREDERRARKGRA